MSKVANVPSNTALMHVPVAPRNACATTEILFEIRFWISQLTEMQIK